MTTRILIIISCAVASSCNDQSNTPGTSTNPVTTACYSAVNDKDSIRLSIKVTGGAVTGDLYYHLLEKDKNTGAIEGKMVGDTIIAEYSFASEGMQSVREVAFLKKGENLVEGFGPVEDINGKMVFKSRSALVFDSANLLLKVECPK